MGFSLKFWKPKPPATPERDSLDGVRKILKEEMEQLREAVRTKENERAAD